MISELQLALRRLARTPALAATRQRLGMPSRGEYRVGRHHAVRMWPPGVCYRGWAHCGVRRAEVQVLRGHDRLAQYYYRSATTTITVIVTIVTTITVAITVITTIITILNQGRSHEHTLSPCLAPRPASRTHRLTSPRPSASPAVLSPIYGWHNRGSRGGTASPRAHS